MYSPFRFLDGHEPVEHSSTILTFAEYSYVSWEASYAFQADFVQISTDANEELRAQSYTLLRNRFYYEAGTCRYERKRRRSRKSGHICLYEYVYLYEDKEAGVVSVQLRQEIPTNKGGLDLIRTMLENGEDINQHCPKTGETLLHDAAWSGDADVVRLLLEYGADVNVPTQKGSSRYWRESEATRETPLHKAVNKAHIAVIKVLLEYGADAQAAALYGYMPLHRAAFASHPETIRLLLEAGANVNATDERGETPLISLAGHCDEVRDWDYVKGSDPLASARLLLQYGADVHHQDKEGQTALTAAEEQGCSDLVALLLQAAGS